MTTEHFSKSQFEAALPKPWVSYLFSTEEYGYAVKLDDTTGVAVLSSVDFSGYAADTGDNSIRCWLVYQEYDIANKPYWEVLGTKVVRWTTRMPGWQKRMNTVIDTLRGWRSIAGDCPRCKEPKHIFKTKQGPNTGRVFAKCTRCGNGFMWLTEGK